MALEPMGTTTLSGAQAFNTATVLTDDYDTFEHAEQAPAIAYSASQAMPAVAPITPMSPISEAEMAELMEQHGVKGYRQDFRSAPMISLKPEGIFEDPTGRTYGKEIVAKIISSAPKFAYSFAGSNDPKNELAYTDEKPGVKTNKDGSRYNLAASDIETSRKRPDGSVVMLSEFLKTIEEKPNQTCKEYAHVVVLLSAPGTALDGAKRTLSVSPNSTISFYDHFEKLIRFGLTKTALTSFQIGEKINHGNSPKYYPWKFEIVV